MICFRQTEGQLNIDNFYVNAGSIRIFLLQDMV